MQAHDADASGDARGRRNFLGRRGREEVVSVGLGLMPRGLGVAAARVRRARPAAPPSPLLWLWRARLRPLGRRMGALATCSRPKRTNLRDRDHARNAERRQARPWCVGQAACTVWADAPSRQDALRRFPQHRIEWDDPSGDGWDRVHLPRLYLHLGQVAGRQECGAARYGQEPLRTRTGGGSGLEPVQPTPADSTSTPI